MIIGTKGSGMKLTLRKKFKKIKEVLLWSGTEMHVDPAATDAYNTCIIGHKLWIYLPNDLYEYEKDWTCNEKCSEKMHELNNPLVWIYNILPQMR